MNKGISLHIGLNYVDPIHYSGWNGKLNAAENDANDMCLLANTQGFQSTVLLRNEATRNGVISTIQKAATSLSTNDFFFITYSGHGGQIPDVSGDEIDGLDETWCLFDGELIDDELSMLWSTFQKGVRIVVLSDSCHSGTITRMINISPMHFQEFTEKVMPLEIALNTYMSNKIFYTKIMKDIKEVDSKEIAASVKLISGCQDNQSSLDGPFNGRFTAALKKVWNGGVFQGNYLEFYNRIKKLMPSDQTPNYYNVGNSVPAFDDENPFSIGQN
jgi:metacaspase-1